MLKRREDGVKDPVKVGRELEGKYGMPWKSFTRSSETLRERTSLQSVALSSRRYTTLVDGWRLNVGSGSWRGLKRDG